MAETVLIADGKGSRRRRLKTLLSALGYHVLAAGSGAAARCVGRADSCQGRIGGPFPASQIPIFPPAVAPAAIL